ncbi:MAG: YHS domain-containing protein [Chloroflexota bacterium]
MASTTIDPVCGMQVDPSTAVAFEYAGENYHFCESTCADTFREDPDRWIPRAPARED